MTTPRAGLALAEVSVKNHEVLMSTARLDDIFVTGFLRERVPGVRLSQLHAGVTGGICCNDKNTIMGVMSRTSYLFQSVLMMMMMMMMMLIIGKT